MVNVSNLSKDGWYFSNYTLDPLELKLDEYANVFHRIRFQNCTRSRNRHYLECLQFYKVEFRFWDINASNVSNEKR